MKLGFEETQAAYSSGSQNARSWTERWVSDRLYCPNCGNSKVDQFPPNTPVADFVCVVCREEFELKSQKNSFGRKIVDGAFRTMSERLAASNNPNLVLLNYDLANHSVTNAFIVPKHFFVQEIIERRRPLAPTARRAGWVGCNILLDRVPEIGKIFVVRGGRALPKQNVLAQWKRTLFLRRQNLEGRGWILEVMRCVDNIGKSEFTLADVYVYEDYLARIYPGNSNVKPKIRQKLQELRDAGYLEFIGRGRYRLSPRG